MTTLELSQILLILVLATLGSAITIILGFYFSNPSRFKTAIKDQLTYHKRSRRQNNTTLTTSSQYSLAAQQHEDVAEHEPYRITCVESTKDVLHLSAVKVGITLALDPTGNQIFLLQDVLATTIKLEHDRSEVLNLLESFVKTIGNQFSDATYSKKTGEPIFTLPLSDVDLIPAEEEGQEQ